MNEKGFTGLEFIGAMALGSLLLAAIMAIDGRITNRWNCFGNKLDLPKYQEIGGVSRYGDNDKIASHRLLGPVFGPEVFQIVEGGENGSIVKIR